MIYSPTSMVSMYRYPSDSTSSFLGPHGLINDSSSSLAMLWKSSAGLHGNEINLQISWVAGESSRVQPCRWRHKCSFNSHLPIPLSEIDLGVEVN